MNSRPRYRKLVAIALLWVFVFDLARPMKIFANGGPGQPEMASFTPASADNMVDLFTGDFSYNIPLLEADGYPLNLAYSSGISPEQEASWVGLGWNLSPGAITRDVSGIPDDFNGDEVIYEKNIKKNVTVGISGGFDGEVAGLPLGLQAGAGLKFNNYTGFDLTTNAGITLGPTEDASFPFSAGLSVNNSSQNGVTVSPNVGLSSRLLNTEGVGGSLTASSSYNSRSGIQEVTYGTNISISNNITNSSVSHSSYNTINLNRSIPRVNTDFENFSITGRFTLGAEIFLSNANAYVNGYFSSQKLRSPIQVKRAYGYMNSGNASNSTKDLMDYSRENEHGFSFEMPALPLAKMNPDVLSVSGQGVSGSYKPYSNAFGVIQEIEGRSTNTGWSAGVEIAAGNGFEAGANGQKNKVNSFSGSWTEDNVGFASLGFKQPKANSRYENVYYQEANEKSQFVNQGFYNSTGRDRPVRMEVLPKEGDEFGQVTTNRLLRTNNQFGGIATNSFSSKRAKRKKPIGILSVEEAENGGSVVPTSELPWPSTSVKPHHIGELTVFGEDGKRHVYGLPVYNKIKKEVSFAVGTTLGGTSYSNTPDCQSGTIQYNPGQDNSLGNSWGLDNYYNSVTTPAYAHSYMPTAILGADYIDADDVKGPSVGDFGEWVKFGYEKNSEDYKWRIPYELNTANYDAGIESDTKDDKANYVYGKKELVYLKRIDTRNYVIEFETTTRKDGHGVTGENGGQLMEPDSGMKKLEAIHMYTRNEFENSQTPVPVKSVHFVYDDGTGNEYELCEGTPANINGGGKLTLQRVYFTYRESNRGMYSGYSFEYSDQNQNYVKGATDRWGYYKPTSSGCNYSAGNDLPASVFPYALQDESEANLNIQNWNLKAVNLPSGGRIEVDYESDRYRYVQHKEATIMKKVKEVRLNGGSDSSGEADIFASGNSSNFKIGIDLDGHEIEDYLSIGDLIYFRTLVDIGEPKPDFITGYGKVSGLSSSGNMGYVQFEGVGTDGGFGTHNPMLVAALQYARLHLSHIVYGSTAIPTDAGLTLQLLEQVLNTFSNLGNIFTNPNQQIIDNDRCKRMFVDKSWIKVLNPSNEKFGGGLRVKELRMYDQWSEMTDAAIEQTVAQVKQYSYVNEDGICSGVASNEPMLGKEENALLIPLALDEANLLAPDNKFWIEEPFAKGFYPSPVVGYERVVVEDKQLKGSNYIDTRTGHTVYEYYSARNFPTLYSETDLAHIHKKTPALDWGSLFGHNRKEVMAFSQGFLVETNDMHGKEKRTSVFAEGQDAAIQYTHYTYKTEPIVWQGVSCSKLVNDENTIVTENGKAYENRTIGMFYDIVADSKEETTRSEIGTVSAQLDLSFALIPIPLPTAYPNKSKEFTSFRYVSLTKRIERFGILEEVRSFDEGRVNRERNLAFDGETGKVVLTQTQNNFNDSYFTMKYPAHWGYKGMSGAYKNIGFFNNGAYLSGSGTLYGVSSSGLADGDEVILKQNGAYIKGWVVKNPGESKKVMDESGELLSGNFQHIKVVRSGYRNQLRTDMMEIISLENPLAGLNNDTYDKVIDASGVEFGSTWRTICNCFGPESSTAGLNTTNPYRMGARGHWRPLRSFSYLTKRSQTDYNDNTNIRRDGVFTSFTPLYERSSGNWPLITENWTYDQEVLDYSPEGYALDSRDPLGRHTSSLYGYNRSLQVAMANNAKNREIGYDGFEDTEDAFCGTDHMRFVSPSNDYGVDLAHTGRKSIRVGNSDPVFISRDLQECEEIWTLNCFLSITTEYVNGTLVITADCFEPPLEINYEVISGDANVEVIENGVIISSSGGNILSLVNVDFYDSEGCYANETYQFVPY